MTAELVLALARETRITLPFTRELRALLEETARGGDADDVTAPYRRLAGAQATIAGAT